MPPKATKKPSTKCLKFGEILMDENRSLILLCTQCALDFSGLSEFRDHLKNCARLRYIFKAQSSSKLDCESGTKMLKKVTKNSKELIIFDFENNCAANATHAKKNNLTDMLSIEAELLDPRWYTDTGENNEAESKTKSSYNDLIEEVTPFVHFKENVKANASGRVTRISAQQAAKEQQSKSTDDIIQNKQKIVPPKTSPTVKLSLSVDKKQVLRHTIQQKPKPLEVAKKSSVTQSPTETSKAILNKPMSRAIAKGASVTDINKNEKQKIIPPNIERVSYKRKAASFPSPKDQNNDESEKTVKRRRTQVQQLPTSLLSKAMPMVKKEPNTKPISSVKGAQIASPGWLPSKNAIILSKKENKTNLNTNSQQRKGRSDILNNKQSPPHTKSQPQISLRIHTGQLQSTTASPNRANNEQLFSTKINKIQIKEMPQTPPKVAHAMPIASSTPIFNKIASYAAQETPCPPTNNNQKTVEILNKLQTLGLKVQRTNPIPEPKNSSGTSKSNEQALEIIKKLQSKGMNVKIVQKPNTMATTQPFTVVHNPGSSIQTHNINNILPFSMTKRVASIANGVLASKTNFRKNVLIKKCS